MAKKELVECKHCHGTGSVNDDDYFGVSMTPKKKPCPACGGTGKQRI